MGNPYPKQSVALDTNILLDLGAEAAYAQNFKKSVQRAGYNFFVPPTALREAAHLAMHGATQTTRTHAFDGLQGLGRWRIQGIKLEDIDRDIVESFARRLIARGLIQSDQWNDGKILGETSLAEIPFLATTDPHLKEIVPEELQILFTDADLDMVTIFDPRRFLRLLDRR